MGYESISTFLLAPSPTAIESPIVRPLDGDLHKLLYYTLATYIVIVILLRIAVVLIWFALYQPTIIFESNIRRIPFEKIYQSKRIRTE